MPVYFVSDIHLKPERPDLSRAFSYFLEHTATDATQLYLLGDIFEAWIGDDCPTPGLDELLQQLKTMSDKGCEIFFQHGNRDFLVGEQFCQSIGAKLLPEEFVLSLPIGNAVVLHGDQLCTDDTEYMQFRALVRNPQWQQDFLSKSLEERLAIARQLRDTSKQRTTEKSDYITDVNADAVKQSFADNKVSLMIHGHTHRPAVHEVELAPESATRIVLGDWDKLGWYLKVDQDGYDLISFEVE
ncbi:UDP-2,3-diacylglucosamine diphosphatase [Neptuniibacter sp. QD48_11]|uniref:UDP-2,3-diacylglucosamine diphosphatase n=1 Tax=unclassified Neptuniibacter TaxID=2630693 RepID=UPI0039F4FEA3